MVLQTKKLTQEQQELITQMKKDNISNIYQYTDELIKHLNDDFPNRLYKLMSQKLVYALDFNIFVNVSKKNAIKQKITDRQVFEYIYITYNIIKSSKMVVKLVFIDILENLINKYVSKINNLNNMDELNVYTYRLNMFSNHKKKYLSDISSYQPSDLMNFSFMPRVCMSDDLYRAFFLVRQEKLGYYKQCVYNMSHINREIYKFQQFIKNSGIKYYVTSVNSSNKWIKSVKNVHLSRAMYNLSDVIKKNINIKTKNNNTENKKINIAIQYKIVEKFMYCTIGYSKLSYQHTIKEIRKITELYHKDNKMLIVRSPLNLSLPKGPQLYEIKTIIFIEDQDNDQINLTIDQKHVKNSQKNRNFITIKLNNSNIKRVINDFFIHNKRITKETSNMPGIKTYTITSNILNKHRRYSKRKLREYRDLDISKLIDNFYKKHTKNILSKRNIDDIDAILDNISHLTFGI